jgi:hypothetical protein
LDFDTFTDSDGFKLFEPMVFFFRRSWTLARSLHHKGKYTLRTITHPNQSGRINADLQLPSRLYNQMLMQFHAVSFEDAININK